MPNTFTWIANGGNWSTPTNWSPVGVPGNEANDTVHITSANNGPIVTLDQVLPNALANLFVDSTYLAFSPGIGLSVNGSPPDGVLSIGASATTQLSGGSLSTAGVFGVSGLLFGFGTVNGAPGSAVLSGNGRIGASGGTLDIGIPIVGGLTLQIDANRPSNLKIDGTATVPAGIGIGGGNQTLEVGATGNLQMGSTELITNGTVQMDGGTLTDLSGVVVGPGARLIGNGTVNGAFSGSFFGGTGIVEASGGTLNLTGAITGPAPGPAFDIDTGAILQLDGNVAPGKTFTFLGPSGQLAYTSFGSITAAINGLNVGTSATQPTNFLDYKNHVVTIVGSGVRSGTDATVKLSDGSFLTLSGVTGSNSGNWFVDTQSDSSGGTDIFLSNTPIASPPPEVWFQHTSGQLAVWQMNGTTFVGGGGVGPNPGPTWFAMGKGAFYTGDTSDIVWQNQNGGVVIWQVQGAQAVGGAFVGDPGPTWHIEGTGDFNNDGHSDIVLQNDDGTGALWEMNGATFIGGGGIGNPGPTWHIEGTGDFYGDGGADILWQNDNGSVAIWNMSGTNFIGGGGVGNPGPDWHIKGTGDFNNDGHTDILWQNDNGWVAIWEMNGTNFIGGGAVGNPGPSWRIKATGDFNNDSHADIVWQNDDGSVALWEMNGTNFIGGGGVGNPGPSWKGFDDTMRFVSSTSANETLTAAAPTPDEFVFTNFAAGIHTIAEFNPVQDMIEFSKAQFGSFADVQAATSAVPGGAMINLGGGSSLLLPGVEVGALHSSNFALA